MRLADRNLKGWSPRGVNDVLNVMDDVEEQVVEVFGDEIRKRGDADNVNVLVPGDNLQVQDETEGEGEDPYPVGGWDGEDSLLMDDDDLLESYDEETEEDS